MWLNHMISHFHNGYLDITVDDKIATKFTSDVLGGKWSFMMETAAQEILQGKPNT